MAQETFYDVLGGRSNILVWIPIKPGKTTLLGILHRLHLHKITP